MKAQLDGSEAAGLRSVGPKRPADSGWCAVLVIRPCVESCPSAPGGVLSSESSTSDSEFPLAIVALTLRSEAEQ